MGSFQFPGEGADNPGETGYMAVYFIVAIIYAFICIPDDGWFIGIIKSIFWFFILVFKLISWGFSYF